MFINVNGEVINTNNKFSTCEEKYEFIINHFDLIPFVFKLSKLPLHKIVEAYREDPELNTLPDEMFYKWAGMKVKNGDVVEDKGYITDWLKRNGMIVYNPVEIVNIFKYGLLKFWKNYFVF